MREKKGGYSGSGDAARTPPPSRFPEGGHQSSTTPRHQYPKAPTGPAPGAKHLSPQDVNAKVRSVGGSAIPWVPMGGHFEVAETPWGERLVSRPLMVLPPPTTTTRVISTQQILRRARNRWGRPL